MYTSNKVMQACAIRALKVILRYKKKKYSFAIILNMHVVRLIQLQSHVESTHVVSGPLKTMEHAIPLHTTKSSENTNLPKTTSKKTQLYGKGSYMYTVSSE
jgi:hypothetical protein